MGKNPFPKTHAMPALTPEVACCYLKKGWPSLHLCRSRRKCEPCCAPGLPSVPGAKLPEMVAVENRCHDAHYQDPTPRRQAHMVKAPSTPVRLKETPVQWSLHMLLHPSCTLCCLWSIQGWSAGSQPDHIAVGFKRNLVLVACARLLACYGPRPLMQLHGIKQPKMLQGDALGRTGTHRRHRVSLQCARILLLFLLLMALPLHTCAIYDAWHSADMQALLLQHPVDWETERTLKLINKPSQHPSSLDTIRIWHGAVIRLAPRTAAAWDICVFTVGTFPDDRGKAYESLPAT